MANTEDSAKANYEHILKCREQYDAVNTEQQTLLDKYIFLIAGTIFNVMLISVDKIVPLASAQWLCLFYVALGSLAFSILCTLSSFKVSAYEANQSVKAMDEALKTQASPVELHKKFQTLRTLLIPISNFCSFWGTVVAIVCLTVFIISNLTNKDLIMSNKTEKPTIAMDGKSNTAPASPPQPIQSGTEDKVNTPPPPSQTPQTPKK